MDLKNFGVAIFFIIGLGMYLCVRRGSFKILEETESKLIGQIRPTLVWAIAVVLGGIAVLLLAFSLTLPPVTSLECTHPEKKIPADTLTFPTDCEFIEISW
jgi:hypothetical protein